MTRTAQHVAQPTLHRRRRPEPAGTGVVRRGGERQSAWHDLLDTVGDAGRGAIPFGEAAVPGHPGAVSQGGPQGGPGRLRQLGGLPLPCPLEMGGKDGAGGSASGHGGDLGERRAHRSASPGPPAWSALHPARPVGWSAPGRQPAPLGGGGGADPGGRGGAPLPGYLRTGRGRCARRCGK